MSRRYPSYSTNKPSGKDWFKTKTATVYHDDNEVSYLIYHSTKVCHLDKKTNTLTLNTGGWKTKTTKDRMNDFMAIHNIYIHIIQKDNIWYIDLEDGKVSIFKAQIATIKINTFEVNQKL